MVARAWMAGLSAGLFGMMVGCGSGDHADDAGGHGGDSDARGGAGGERADAGGRSGGTADSGRGGVGSGSGSGGGGRETQAGAGGSGEAGDDEGGAGTPATPPSTLPSTVIRPVRIDKVDLLFMIDNSISMADKQALLQKAVPRLLRRLVTPICVDEEGRATGNDANAGTCPQGEVPEFEPLQDIHIAIVTSSLGGHGGEVCDGSPSADPSTNDHAHPLGRVRTALSGVGWDDTGFLAWDPDAARGAPRNEPPGTSNRETLEADFQKMVGAVGETGCGYEASLESWYRFLIDPSPPLQVKLVRDASNPGETVAEGVDETLLELRARFLRQDSLVAITMLSDENDCSIRDAGQSWLLGTGMLAGQPFQMPRSTSACESDPDDPCCVSCASAMPAGCAPDPACSMPNDRGTAGQLSAVEDSMNLRCYRQKQRFGVDFLHPVQRYVDGLTKATIANAEGVPVPNPLYVGAQRDTSMVFLVGIVGVPWQDVSTEASWAPDAPLEYLTTAELEEQGRFDWILAKDAGSFPKDGLMLETPLDRTTVAGLPQTHPGIGAPLAASGTAQRSNPINGKETTIPDGVDLQYACIYPLEEPVVGCTNDMSDCDCRPNDAMYDRALCDGTTQTHAKAYPGVRQLEVLRRLAQESANAVVASICPKVTDSARSNDSSYGYTPAVSAIVRRLRHGFARSCVSAPLEVCGCVPTPENDCVEDAPCAPGASAGQIACSVVEATRPASSGACAPCEGGAVLGRTAVTDELAARARKQLEDVGSCGGTSGIACDEVCLCAIPQLEADELESCEVSLERPTENAGFCYVDPTQPTALSDPSRAEALVSSCPETKHRMIRFTGVNVPAQGATALLLCREGP